MISLMLKNAPLLGDDLHHSRLAPGRSLLANVLSRLAGRILCGELLPGDTLANEAELMAELGVSRTTVREAVKILSGKGLVETRQRVGTRVLPRGDWNLLDGDVLAWMMVSMDPSGFMRELLEMRRIFEPEAAALAARRATDSDIATLARACVTMEQEDIGVEAFVRADATFHETLLVGAHNQFLSGMANGIRASLYMFLRLTTEDPAAFEKGRPFHRTVFDRVVARDPDGARQAMRDLLDGAEDLVDRLIGTELPGNRVRNAGSRR